MTLREDALSVVSGRPYPEACEELTQEGPEGLRFDFNQGVRVKVPEGQWRVRFTDLDTAMVLFDMPGENCFLGSRKRYFLRGKIEAFRAGQLVFSHEYDARGKEVAVCFPRASVAEALGWFSYAVRFGQKHGCSLVMVLPAEVRELMAGSYPDIEMIGEDEFPARRRGFYATYHLGLFAGEDSQDMQPVDFRLVGQHRVAGYCLGVSSEEGRPAVDVSGQRPIAEPYVVVSSQVMGTQSQHWNNPRGWHEVVTFLKDAGFRVVCLDAQEVSGQGLHWNFIPHGVEDQTGKRSLVERALWLRHAAFFVGVAGDLGWLAWAVGVPVVLISGVTLPMNEFYTPYRVFNALVCHGCWHDVRHPFRKDEFLFCPLQGGTERQFECTRLIAGAHVIRTIQAVLEEDVRRREVAPVV